MDKGVRPEITGTTLDEGSVRVFRGTNITISGNTILDGDIVLSESYDNLVENNAVTGGGISVVKTADNYIYSNTVDANKGGAGIDARSSSCNRIVGNTVHDCRVGIVVGDSQNRIFMNDFADNTLNADSRGGDSDDDEDDDDSLDWIFTNDFASTPWMPCK